MIDLDRRQFIVRSGAVALGASTFGWPLAAHAQAPETARILVGFPAGGTTDAVSRRIAERLQGSYAKTVLVDNKAGAETPRSVAGRSPRMIAAALTTGSIDCAYGDAVAGSTSRRMPAT